MCMFCVELIKGRITLDDARRNLKEIIAVKFEQGTLTKHMIDLSEALEEDDLQALGKILSEEEDETDD